MIRQSVNPPIFEKISFFEKRAKIFRSGSTAFLFVTTMAHRCPATISKSDVRGPKKHLLKFLRTQRSNRNQYVIFGSINDRLDNQCDISFDTELMTSPWSIKKSDWHQQNLTFLNLDVMTIAKSHFFEFGCDDVGSYVKSL
jgi:hypothetical protein